MDKPKIYIASSPKNREVNEEIVRILESHGYEVYLPQRDTPQYAGLEIVFESNTRAIREADLIVAVLIDYECDLGFELGYAYALGKPIIAFARDKKYLKDKMIAGSLSKVAFSIRELTSEVKNRLRSS